METVTPEKRSVKNSPAKVYLTARGVLESTFLSHGGEFDFSPAGDKILRRLNRSLDKARSILWFEVSNFKGERSRWLARPFPTAEKLKFVAPVGSDSVPWIPSETRDIAKSTDVPLVITEGPIKGMVLLQAGAHPISLQGVWGIAASRKKSPLECGGDFEEDTDSAVDNSDSDNDDGRLKLHGEIARFPLWRRRVYLCFDADSAKNRDVRQAEIRACLLLHSQGAEVFRLSWPLEEGKGIDDYLTRRAGTDSKKQAQVFAELIERAEPFIKTLGKADVPIVKKELHRTITDSAVFDALAGELKNQLGLSKASLGKFRYGKQEDQQAAKQTKEIEQIEPWPEPVSLHEAFSGVVTLFRTYMFMTEAQIVAVVLWCATTFLYDLLQIHAYLGITAPTKLCGKTTLVNLVALFVRQGLIVAGRVSAAFIYRAIDKFRPTFIVDESQAIFRKSPDVEDIFNAGHVRSTAYVGLVEKVNDEFVERLYNVFCPKVIGLKGKIHDDSLQDRVIEIRLSRIHKSDLKEDFWDVFAKIPKAELFVELRSRFVRAVLGCAEAFKSHEPELPEFSNGRLKQNWKPLWILAELADQSAGTEYWCSQLAEAIEECEEEALSEPSFQDYLVKSLKEFCEEYQKRPSVLARKPAQRDLIPTEEILSHSTGLNADKEAPWFAKDREGLTRERLARELRGFKAKRIQRRINVGENAVRGYSRRVLQKKVFERYVK